MTELPIIPNNLIRYVYREEDWEKFSRISWMYDNFDTKSFRIGTRLYLTYDEFIGYTTTSIDKKLLLPFLQKTHFTNELIRTKFHKNVLKISRTFGFENFDDKNIIIQPGKRLLLISLNPCLDLLNKH